MVPPASHGIPRVPRYSGYRSPLPPFGYGTLTLSGPPSHAVLLAYRRFPPSTTPENLRLPVCPLPRSLATTCGISVDFSSSPYLDVSVQAVSLIQLSLLFYCMMTVRYHRRIAPFGNPRINAYLRLPVAYRSLSRPSSAPSAKAFALRPL